MAKLAWEVNLNYFKVCPYTISHDRVESFIFIGLQLVQGGETIHVLYCIHVLHCNFC